MEIGKAVTLGSHVMLSGTFAFGPISSPQLGSAVFTQPWASLRYPSAQSTCTARRHSDHERYLPW